MREYINPALLIITWSMISACSVPVFSGQVNRVDVSTKALAAHIALNWPLVSATEPSVLRVREVGRHLAVVIAQDYSLSSPPQWRFTVFKDQAITVFSIAGGRIYLSDGAVQVCHDEAELAALIAHEMAHQIAGHFQSLAMSHDAIKVPIGLGYQEIDLLKEKEADRMSISILEKSVYDYWGVLKIAKRVLSQIDNPRERNLHEQRIISLKYLLKNYPMP